MIDKDTIVCISISKKAGNFGCMMHNKAFKEKGLNYIYKSFSVDDEMLEDSIRGIRALKIRGAGVSMPYKVEVLNHVDEVSEEVLEIGATNTLVNTNGHIKAYNTDVYSSHTVIKEYRDKFKINDIAILGNGGYAKAVKYSVNKLDMNYSSITRKNWNDIGEIRNSIVFNCTPVENINNILHSSNHFIDCLTTTATGARLATLQGEKQFDLYVNGEKK